MTRPTILFAMLLAAAPAGAQQPSKPAPAAKADSQVPSPKLQSLLENCDAHKFETTVDTTVDGQPHRSKVKLCGKDGQSDSDWIGTLEDAIAKLDSNKDMQPAVREQIASAIKAEIARLESQTDDSASSGTLLTPRGDTAPAPLSNDYSSLPPLPAPPAQQSPALELAATGATTTMAPVAPRPALVAKPRLSFSCISPEFPGGGECISLSRDTVITVKAGEPIADSISLRFLRNGEDRGDVALGAMRKGQSLRFELPQSVCKGIVSAEIEMQVIRSNQTVDRQGPFLLRC
jgi:hypothetical protein